MSNKFRDCSVPTLKEKIIINAGDYLEFDVFVTAPIGPEGALDLTGCTVSFTAADDLFDPDEVIEKSNLTSGVIIISAVDGQARIILESADTLTLGPRGGFMFYEIKLEDTEGRIFTIASGSLIFQDGVS